jgi:hypothetical protein
VVQGGGLHDGNLKSALALVEHPNSTDTGQPLRPRILLNERRNMFTTLR